MAELFVKLNDREASPYSSDELKRLASSGEFKENDLVFHEDTQEWLQAGEIDELDKIFELENPGTRERTVFAVGGGKGGVGKTILTASLGIGLASLGKKVIIVDADLGGANLHTAMGILEPKYTFYHFYTLQRDKLSDIVLDTPIENLKLISGACGTLGLANPRFSQKQRFLAELRELDADYILLDLGAGASYNVIDFFLAADQGILVTTPEPMAIQETFNFVKIALYRKLSREFRNSPTVSSLLEQDLSAQPGRMARTTQDLLDELQKSDKIAAKKIQDFLNLFRPRLILNMVQAHEEIKEGDSLKTALKELLSIDINYMGPIDYDKNVRKSIRSLKPFILDNPKSKASRSITKIITAGIMKKSGFQGFKHKRRAIQNITDEAKNFPKTNLKKSEVICSVKCFYWNDCEYQEGGYPCPIRHLEPIFGRQSK